MIKFNSSLNCLISIELPEEEAVQRLLNRGKTSGRSDDNEVVIRNRLKEYYEKTIPVLQFYKDKGIYYDVDGRTSIDVVREDITKIVKQELSKSLLNIILFGYPGCGRGSQGRALAKQFNLEYIATGEMLAQEASSGSKVGQRIIELYNKGLLTQGLVGQMFPDDIVVQLIEQKFQNNEGAKGFIFKGFPRTLVQSYILDGLLRKNSSSITKVIEIEVPILELISRLEHRSKTVDKMHYDESMPTIIRRLQDHEYRTVPVVKKYTEIHGSTKINGVGTFEEVNKRIADEIEFGFKNLR